MIILTKIMRNMERTILFIVKNYNKNVFEDSFLFSSSKSYNLIIQFIAFPSRQSKISAIDLAQLEGWQSGNAADC